MKQTINSINFNLKTLHLINHPIKENDRKILSKNWNSVNQKKRIFVREYFQFSHTLNFYLSVIFTDLLEASYDLSPANLTVAV